MGKTYRAARPNPDCNIPDGRVVKESTRTKFTKALRRFTHHHERRQAVREISHELQEAI
jgi:hypothetical protein